MNQTSDADSYMRAYLLKLLKHSGRFTFVLRC